MGNHKLSKHPFWFFVRIVHLKCLWFSNHVHQLIIWWLKMGHGNFIFWIFAAERFGEARSHCEEEHQDRNRDDADPKEAHLAQVDSGRRWQAKGVRIVHFRQNRISIEVHDNEIMIINMKLYKQQCNLNLWGENIPRLVIKIFDHINSTESVVNWKFRAF